MALLVRALVVGSMFLAACRHAVPAPVRTIDVGVPGPAAPVAEPERRPLVEGPVRVVEGNDPFLKASLHGEEVLALKRRALWHLSLSDPGRARVEPLDFEAKGMLGPVGGLLFVVRADNAIVVLRDRTIVKTLPGIAGMSRAMSVSADGSIFVHRIQNAMDSYDRTGTSIVFDVASGAELARLVDVGSVAIDPSGTWLIGDDGIYDRRGRPLWERPHRMAAKRSMPLAIPMQSAMTDRTITTNTADEVFFFDTASRKATSAPFGCPNDVPAVALAEGARLVRVCPTEVLAASAVTRTVTRIPLPVASSEPAASNPWRERNNGPMFLPGTEVLGAVVRGECWRADPRTKKASSAQCQELVPLTKRGHAEASWGNLVIARKGQPDFVWGEPRTDDSATLDFAVSARGIEIYVTTPSQRRPVSAFRFGDSVALPTPRPDGEGASPVAQTERGALFVADKRRLRRVLDGKSTETVLPGDVFSAALADDGRAFVVLRASDPNNPTGETTDALELAAADLKIVRKLDGVPAYSLLRTTTRDLVVHTNMTPPLHASFYPLSRTCVTCTPPVARLTSWSTFAIYEHDGKMDIAGDRAQAEEALLCFQGDTVRRGPCR